MQSTQQGTVGDDNLNSYIFFTIICGPFSIKPQHCRRLSALIGQPLIGLFKHHTME